MDALDANPAPSTARRGRPARSVAEREARRAHLVGAAIEAVRELGADASIDDIASAIGVSKPVLYDVVGDKLGLADAMAAVIAEEVTASVAEAASVGGGAPGVEAVVGAVVNAMVELIERDGAIYGFLVKTIRSGDRGFFDSALVRVVRERASLLAPTFAPGVPNELVPLLIDGAFGFLFFAVESWQVRRVPGREVLVAALTATLSGASVATAAATGPKAAR